MFSIEDVLQLKDSEDVKFVVRRHPVSLVPGLGTALLLIVIPFFFLFPLFAWGIPGVVVFATSAVIGIIVAIRTVLLWNADVLIITTLRLVEVDQRGILSRFVTEVPLNTIQDVSWRRQGIVDTLFKTGTIAVQTAGASPNIDARRVAHPERIHEAIGDLRHATAPKRADLSPDLRERLRKLALQLEHLSPQALDRVELLVKQEGRGDAMSAFLDTDV